MSLLIKESLPERAKRQGVTDLDFVTVPKEQVSKRVAEAMNPSVIHDCTPAKEPESNLDALMRIMASQVHNN